MQKTINHSITISPTKLNGNIQENLLQEAIVELQGTCNSNYGYILKINKLVSIVDNHITLNSNIIFNIVLDILVFKPEQNMIVDGIISSLETTGIYVLVNNVMSMYIPLEYTNNKYKNGETLQCKIIAIKFSGDKFISIGKLVM